MYLYIICSTSGERGNFQGHIKIYEKIVFRIRFNFNHRSCGWAWYNADCRKSPSVWLQNTTIIIWCYTSDNNCSCVYWMGILAWPLTSTFMFWLDFFGRFPYTLDRERMHKHFIRLKVIENNFPRRLLDIPFSTRLRPTVTSVLAYMIYDIQSSLDNSNLKVIKIHLTSACFELQNVYIRTRQHFF